MEAVIAFSKMFNLQWNLLAKRDLFTSVSKKPLFDGQTNITQNFHISKTFRLYRMHSQELKIWIFFLLHYAHSLSEIVDLNVVIFSQNS